MVNVSRKILKCLPPWRRYILSVVSPDSKNFLKSFCIAALCLFLTLSSNKLRAQESRTGQQARGTGLSPHTISPDGNRLFSTAASLATVGKGAVGGGGYRYAAHLIDSSWRQSCQRVLIFGSESSNHGSKRQTIVGWLNWERATTRVVIATRWPIASRGNPDTVGAVSTMIDLASSLRIGGTRTGVMFVFLDGEDPKPFPEGGLPEYLAKNPICPSKAVVLGYVGLEGLTIPREANGNVTNPDLSAEIYLSGRDLGLTSNSLGPRINDIHMDIAKAGIPAVYVGCNRRKGFSRCSKIGLERTEQLLLNWLLTQS